MAKHHIETTVNGDAVEFLCETEDTLLDVLRDTLNMTGSKEGCASGDCGACSVTLDGRLVCSCLVLGCEVGGRRIETMRACAWGLRSTLPISWPARLKSAPKRARPVTLSTPSGRIVRVPT